MENGKPGVYLCRGCGIGDAVSVDDLEKVATGKFDVPLCRQHDCLCSEDGVKSIAKDIGDGAVDTDTQVTRANLREQVVWTHPPGEKNTQMMAADNVRMAIAQAVNARAPQARSEDAFSRRIMVVGGGVSGLTAAREISKTGHEALLVERSDVLGGWARK